MAVCGMRRGPEDHEVVTIGETFDAHNLECARRYLSRLNKSVKEAAKVERETQAAPQAKDKK